MAPKKRSAAGQPQPQPPTAKPQKKQRGADGKPHLERNESRAESSDDALSIASMAAYLIVELKKDAELVHRLGAHRGPPEPGARASALPTGLNPEQRRKARDARVRKEQRHRKEVLEAAGSNSTTGVGVNQYALGLVRKLLDDKKSANDSCVGSPGYARFRKIVEDGDSTRVGTFLQVVRYSMLTNDNGTGTNPFMDPYNTMKAHICGFGGGGDLVCRKLREGLNLCGRTVKVESEPKTAAVPNGPAGFCTLAFLNPLSTKTAVQVQKKMKKTEKPHITGTPLFYFARIARLARKQRRIIKALAEGPRGEDPFDQDGCPAKGSQTEVAYRQVRAIGEVILGIIGAMGMPSRTGEIGEQMTEASYLCKIKQPAAPAAAAVDE